MNNRLIENNIDLEALKKDNPVLLDKVIQGLQDTLSSKLSWLDYAFGRGYKLVEHLEDGEKLIYPAFYNGEGEYKSLLPNDNYGNFCWFDIYDPQEVIPISQGLPQYVFSGALIFWYDISKIYADSSKMYTEEVKDEVLALLTTPGILSVTGTFKVGAVYERFENIYRDYSIERIYNNFAYKGQNIQSMDKQYFMWPYCGLRIEFSIITRELCQRYIK